MAEALTDGNGSASTLSESAAQQQRGAVPAPVLVDSGARFEGTLTFRGASRIEGEFQGEIAASGRLELADSSKVTGRVEVDEIVVGGRFDGELRARRSVLILAGAEVTGSVATARLEIAEGCRVKAKCRTGRSVEASNQSPSPA